jgi:ATP-dependent protease ClpP protease subunit
MQATSPSSLTPAIRLFGKVDEAMLREFFRQQAQADPGQPAMIELSTSGGDADIGRRIAYEIGQWQQATGQRATFIGKSFVYSAGVTIMSAVDADRRFLSADCELLIHERKISKVLHLEGALRGCRTLVQDALAEIDSGQRLERVGFADLVRDTPLSVDAVLAKLFERDWYLTAREALELGLVGGIL